MKKLRLFLTLSLAAGCLAMPAPLAASGSYTSRPPQPGAVRKSVDRAKYTLGQRIFNGKVKPTATTDAAPQTEPLKRLQSVLPKKVGAKTNLTSMAGKLTSEQLEALEYYVLQRYAK